MVNESAPRSETIASVTDGVHPGISATTVMIDDTATMLPSSVSIDRSLFAQIDASASRRIRGSVHRRRMRLAVGDVTWPIAAC